jgi:hypothetical protein
MFNIRYGAGAASCYGFSSPKMMWILAAPAPQQCSLVPDSPCLALDDAMRVVVQVV